MQSIYSRDQGHGRPLVFIHGFCETLEVWEDFVEPLSRKYRTLTIDLPGFGRSSPLQEPIIIDHVADAVADWIREVRIHDPVIIGHSLGGYVALGLAERHPELVAAFVLLHSHAFADSQEKKESRDKVISFVQKNGVGPYVDTFVPGLFHDQNNPAVAVMRRIADGTQSESLIEYAAAMRDRPDRSSQLLRVEIPKAIIAGVEDTLIPVAISREMSKIARNCNYFELPSVGHMGFFEAKNDCELMITQFADGLI